MTNFIDASGDLLDADVDVLVNTVNTVGVMGKGVALQFKRAFPANLKAYEQACKRNEVVLGKMFLFDNGQITRPCWIVNFPTKAHWRSRSRLSDIETGLDDLRAVMVELKITSIALPPLGCGNGGLDWSDVRPLIEDKLQGLDAEVHVYAPAGAPAAADMRIATSRPVLTPGKAALVAMVDRYSAVAFEASLIEIQKLMYLLQEAGEPLKLRYQAQRYGPYADNLRHVLKALEGHHLEGFGDGSAPVDAAEPIRVLKGAAEEAAGVLAGEPIVERMERVLSLIEGFESAYGLELLATVHWTATKDNVGDNLDTVTKQVQEWNSRKQRMFTKSHIETALNQLRDEDWLNPGPSTPAESVA